MIRTAAASALRTVTKNTRQMSSVAATPMPRERMIALRAMLDDASFDRPVRVLETHNGLTGLIAEHAAAPGPDGTERTFDAMWSSSLTASTSKGMPDIETVTTSERIELVRDTLACTTKPLIYDGDTGGHPAIFRFTVQKLEQIGVSACIIEDKTGLKQNSLFGTDAKQELEDIDEYCEKIKAGVDARINNEFMIIARMESLIAGWGEEEALMRSQKSIEAGADAIMIHSKEKSPDEVLSFLSAYSRLETKVPVVTVPTTYNAITEEELYAAGSSVVIYANHLLRAAYPAMTAVAESILTNSRSQEADSTLLPVKTIINMIQDNSGR
jgi:phosphoenolpyruvate phosphomutase